MRKIFREACLPEYVKWPLRLVASLHLLIPLQCSPERLGDSTGQTRGGTMRTGVEVKAADEQRRRLEAIAADGNSKAKHQRRARIVLLTADGLGTMAISDGL